MTAAITQIDRAHGLLEAGRFSDDWVREMGHEAVEKEVHYTTHIEGTRFTLDQAERLWKGEAPSDADPADVCELLNYQSAFEFISECLDIAAPITKGLIRETHKKLVEGVRGDNAAPRKDRSEPCLRGLSHCVQGVPSRRCQSRYSPFLKMLALQTGCDNGRLRTDDERLNGAGGSPLGFSGVKGMCVR